MKTIVFKNIRLPYTAPLGEAVDIALKRARNAGIKISSPYIYKRSIDSRHRDNILFVYSVAASCDKVNEKQLKKTDANIEKDGWVTPTQGKELLSARPVVCGFGPAGMFASLLLAEQGYRPIVLERGSCVKTRAEKVENFMRTGVLDTSCNIQFGAGGAGTFSDGKLVTRISDSACRYVFDRFVEFGAPEEIMYDAKPHIGTDKLLGIVDAISRRVVELGGEIYYDTALRAINKTNNRVCSVVTDKGEIDCGALILAVGNSARDTYRYLMAENYVVEPKPFSVGVRIEHLREDIDRAMYGDHAGDPLLGAAPYAFSKRVGEDAVYTFCMCPGGEVIAAASEENTVVTNGMSRYARNGVNSNAAIAVSVRSDDPIAYQEALEQRGYAAGGGEYYAPCQSVGDFLDARQGVLPHRIKPTYMGGKVRAYDLNSLFERRICDMLKLGIASFDRILPGFAVRDALLTGPETRTSAPVRITRNGDLLALGVDNLYPSGEGAGYAGGITSAAVDGLRCAAALISRYKRN
ncbi:MAG: NAD(P)/FAD-dependent oxidoreductase [Clostridia bacterium]|nr:NAD(P)/FAD-dependent oxidoreductase [Clostridia bacterium]